MKDRRRYLIGVARVTVAPGDTVSADGYPQFPGELEFVAFAHECAAALEVVELDVERADGGIESVLPGSGPYAASRFGEDVAGAWRRDVRAQESFVLVIAAIFVRLSEVEGRARVHAAEARATALAADGIAVVTRRRPFAAASGERTRGTIRLIVRNVGAVEIVLNACFSVEMDEAPSASIEGEPPRASS